MAGDFDTFLTFALSGVFLVLLLFKSPLLVDKGSVDLRFADFLFFFN